MSFYFEIRGTDLRVINYPESENNLIFLLVYFLYKRNELSD